MDSTPYTRMESIPYKRTESKKNNVIEPIEHESESSIPIGDINIESTAELLNLGDFSSDADFGCLEILLFCFCCCCTE